MQLFNLIKKTQLTIVSVLFISGVSYADPIGDIIESTGLSSLVRDQERLESTVNLEVELYDTAETANGRMLIEFLDKAELALTEHTRILIDEVIFDPDPSKSKMTMRFVQGTARFASGKLALMNKQNIDIQTPTATIGIRGTDFTTSVDEIGRSLVILLPDENGDASGEITVTNQGGTITLDQAYQATMVSTLDTPPTQSVQINNITPSMIDNMFIVNPPTEVKEAIEEQVADDTNDDKGILDIDFLEYNELDKDYDDYANDPDYDARSSRIDIDYLAGDFLPDMLDVIEALIRTTEELGDVRSATGQDGWSLKDASFGFNKDSQYNIFVEDGNLIFFRDMNGVINITIASGGNGFISSRFETYEGIIEFGSGEGIEIYINQSN